MKRYNKILLSMLVIISMMLITMSFITENIVVKTFFQEILSKKVSGYFLDELVCDLDVNELGIIENNIRKSKYTEKITLKFIQTIVKNVAYNQNIKFDISHEVDLLILENMPENLLKEKKNNTKEYLIQNLSSTRSMLEENFTYSFGDNYLIILKEYSVFTDMYFRIIVAVLFIFSIGALVLIEKIKSINLFKVSSIIVSTLTIVLFVGIKILSSFINDRLAGGWLHTINLNLMFIFIVIEIIISIILIIVSEKIKTDAQMV